MFLLLLNSNKNANKMRCSWIDYLTSHLITCNSVVSNKNKHNLYNVKKTTDYISQLHCLVFSKAWNHIIYGIRHCLWKSKCLEYNKLRKIIKEWQVRFFFISSFYWNSIGKFYLFYAIFPVKKIYFSILFIIRLLCISICHRENAFSFHSQNLFKIPLQKCNIIFFEERLSFRTLSWINFLDTKTQAIAFNMRLF